MLVLLNWAKFRYILQAQYIYRSKIPFVIITYNCIDIIIQFEEHLKLFLEFDDIIDTAICVFQSIF